MKKFIKDKLRDLLSESVIKLKHDLKIPNSVLRMTDIFKDNGHKLYVVGGAVRDSLINKPIKDWDLATDAKPEKVEAMMKRAGFKTLGTGEQFGVMNVFIDDEEFEVATFRRDVSYGEKDLETFLKFLKNKDEKKYKLFLQKIKMK